MITEKDVRDMAIRFLGEDADILVRRSNGGHSTPCGYSLTVFFDDRGSETKFFHDDNTWRTLESKMLDFVEIVENPVT